MPMDQPLFVGATEREPALAGALATILAAVVEACQATPDGLNALALVIAMSDAWNIAARLLITSGVQKGKPETDTPHSCLVLRDILRQLEEGVDAASTAGVTPLTLADVAAVCDRVRLEQNFLASADAPTGVAH